VSEKGRPALNSMTKANVKLISGRLGGKSGLPRYIAESKVDREKERLLFSDDRADLGWNAAEDYLDPLGREVVNEDLFHCVSSFEEGAYQEPGESAEERAECLRKLTPGLS
jgi:hypothetical protein